MALTQRSVPQLLLLALIGALLGCDCADRQHQNSTPQASLPAEETPPPAPPPAPPPWFSGRWQGTSTLRVLEPALLIDSRERNPKKSQRAVEGEKHEDLQKAEGPLISLLVNIGDDKTISGEARVGPGDSSVLSVRGILDEEILRLALRGEKSAGTLVAGRHEQGFDGTVRLSDVEKNGSEHSTTAFETRVQLSRKVPAEKP